MNDYYTTRAKSRRWVMVSLYYMLDTARVNAKTTWCMKEDIDMHKFDSFNFGWNLAKSLALPHVSRRNVNGLSGMVQLKIKLFLGNALVVPVPLPKIERRFESTGARKRCSIHMANCNTKQEKDNIPKSTEQCQSCERSICRAHSMSSCNECLK